MAIKLLGLFLGVFARTWIPYIRKLKQGKIKGFDKKFLKFALGSVILSGISVLLIIPQYKYSETEIIDFWTALKVFATAFAFGFGWNTVVNESIKWNEKKTLGR
ncbi:MAG: hypothetical protein JXJ19_05290 [Elusimicrobia bacterium]|nr:hypothetical protein [Elusimicrobiota bacterium]